MAWIGELGSKSLVSWEALISCLFGNIASILWVHTLGGEQKDDGIRKCPEAPESKMVD